MEKSAGESLLSEKLNSVTVGSMDCVNEALIPGLPDDLALICLAKISHGFLGVLQCVSKRWRNVIRSEDYLLFKSRMGRCGDWIFVSMQGVDESQWKAYDPEADRWHAIPPTPMPSMSGGRPVGFSCVSVCNRFLVIGGLYFDCGRLVVTNQVLSFDPYRQEWSVLASMSTPRAKFACSVISDKVYVGGGINLAHNSQRSLIALSSAEVYDPVKNRWEDLPTMPNPRYGRFGISYNSKFYFRDDGSDLYDGETTDMFIFSPLDGQWCSRHDEWQKPPILIHDICVINDHLYTFMSGDNFKERSVETFNIETGDWVRVGLVPAVTLPDNPQHLKWTCGEICGLRNKVYIMGGSASTCQKLYQGSQCVHVRTVHLKTMRFCDPSTTPLQWRETTVPGGDCDYITSCASLEELQR